MKENLKPEKSTINLSNRKTWSKHKVITYYARYKNKNFIKRSHAEFSCPRRHPLQKLVEQRALRGVSQTSPHEGDSAALTVSHSAPSSSAAATTAADVFAFATTSMEEEGALEVVGPPVARRSHRPSSQAGGAQTHERAIGAKSSLRKAKLATKWPLEWAQ